MKALAGFLNTLFGGLNGKKSWTGFAGIVLGLLLYTGQQYGVVPNEPSGTGKAIVDFFINTFLYGGGGLNLIGIGDKMGKVRNGEI